MPLQPVRNRGRRLSQYLRHFVQGNALLQTPDDNVVQRLVRRLRRGRRLLRRLRRGLQHPHRRIQQRDRILNRARFAYKRRQPIPAPINVLPCTRQRLDALDHHRYRTRATQRRLRTFTRRRFFQRALQDGLYRTSMPVVGLGARFVARALDTFLLYTVFAPILFLGLYLSMLSEEAVAPLAVATMFLGSLFGFAISLFYYIYFVGRFGGTPGKLVLGYAIVRGDGSRMNMSRAAGRYFAEYVTLFTFGIGYLMIAYTRVVRRDEAP